jgi:hypothetical protein
VVFLVVKMNFWLELISLFPLFVYLLPYSFIINIKKLQVHLEIKLIEIKKKKKLDLKNIFYIFFLFNLNNIQILTRKNKLFYFFFSLVIIIFSLSFFFNIPNSFLLYLKYEK